jgi:hypothetical protein
MKVHIVRRAGLEDSLLTRLAHQLAKGTGWSLSASPDPQADLNYFILYINYAERYTDWGKTPVAAYFSHYETGTPYKEFWWDLARERVQYPVITAEQYREGLSSRRVIRVCPPLDSEHFTIGNSKHDGLRVGVAGFVDRSGRKGPELVARLAGSDLGRQIDLVASGEGWPISTKNREYEVLPAYYNSLDVFLCTSRIEGIPLPPLEALACGVPVVIPIGVGMLDELPRMPGIYRFPAGDYERMELAIKAAIETETDREALRGAVAEYSLAQWCDDHKKGFKAASKNETPPRKEESCRWGQRGVFYVAFGEPARRCAKGAMESFKHHMPDIPIALASDKPIGVEDVFIQRPDIDIGGRVAKLQVYDLAPPEWAYILYLDADTEIVAPIYFLYELLEDGWDMTICRNPGKYHTARKMIRSDNADECEITFDQIGSDNLIQLNGGVFAFQRNPRTAAFFKKWYEEWQKWGKRDQAALLRALFQNPLKLYVLGVEWNTITRYEPKAISAGILHYPMTARRWRGLVPGRLDGDKAWEQVKQWEKEQQ